MPHQLFQHPAGGPHPNSAAYPPQTAASAAAGGGTSSGPAPAPVPGSHPAPPHPHPHPHPHQMAPQQLTPPHPHSVYPPHPAMYHHYEYLPYGYAHPAAAAAAALAHGGAAGGGPAPPPPVMAPQTAASASGQQVAGAVPHIGIPYRRSTYGQPSSSAQPNITSGAAAATVTVSPSRTPNPALSNTSSVASTTATTATAAAAAGNATTNTSSSDVTIATSNQQPQRNAAARRLPIKSEGSGDSAEDIAASALSMLCGAAEGVAKREEAEKKAAAAAAAAAADGQTACRGSPSFEEGKAKMQQQAAATAASAAAIATTTEKSGPCHVSPVSTVGSNDVNTDASNANTPGSSSTANTHIAVKQEEEQQQQQQQQQQQEQALTESAKVAEGASIVSRLPADAAATASTTSAASGHATTKLPHFPSLLHDVLTRSRHAGTVLEWLPHGQGWRVLRWDDMAKTVIPEHFAQFCAHPGKGNDGEGGGANKGGTTKQRAGGGGGDADVNAFLWHVRAWGFQECRDVGPDMGSYRHGLFLRGNPNLSLQMRLISGPAAASSSSSADANDVQFSSLQVPSLLTSASTGSGSGTADKRKIGQTVSRDSTSTAGGSPPNKRGRFVSLPHPPPPGGPMFLGPPPSQAASHLFMHPHHHLAAQMMQGPPRKMSDAIQPPVQPHHRGAPPAPPGAAGAIFRGAPHGAMGGRVSMRGRNRGASAAAPAPRAVPPLRHPAAPGLASFQPSQGRVDRRDETEHRGAPASYARTNFPVSTRGRGGRGGPVRAPTRANNNGSGTGAAMMMKGVVPVVASSPATATGVVSAPSPGVATAVSKKSKEAAKTAP